jgi:hypothetical protein
MLYLSTSPDDVVQLFQEQLEAERRKVRQFAFNVAELQKEVAILSRELLQARLELAQRVDVVAGSPTLMKH